MTYNRRNFHKSTFCIFTETSASDLPKTTPDYISKSGSEYYFTSAGVFRHSDHWGRAAKCKWQIKGGANTAHRRKIGYADWGAFYPDNEREALYFLSFDEETGVLSFSHRGLLPANSTAVCRTAADTMALIRQLRHLLATDSWAKHYDIPINSLRRELINRAIGSRASLQQIRRELQEDKGA